jgi:hypothetical protein
LIDLAHKRRRIVVYLKRLQVLIDAFKSRVSTDSGTFEGESNLKKQLQFIQNLFTSIVVLTPNAWKTSILYTILQNDGTTDFDFVRNTAATRVNESGLIETVGNNIPRIDWFNGKPQILIEPQRTNLLLHSNNYNLSWSTGAGTSLTDNFTISPDGTTNASKLERVSTTAFRLNQTVAVVPGDIYTASFYVKNINASQLNFQLRDLTNGVTFFSFNYVNDINTTEWTRLNYTATIPVGCFSLAVYIFNNNIPIGQGCIVYGAQFEEGTQASSYIPTTSAIVTRNADIATLDPPTGTAEIIETVNGVDNTITTIPTTYQLPEGRVDKVIMIASEYDEDFQEVLNEANRQGFDIPSESVLEAMNALVLSLKSDGIWSKLDTYFNFATNSTSFANFSRICWKRRVLGTINGGLITTVNGFEGNGVDAGFFTGFNPDINGINYQLNNASKITVCYKASGDYVLQGIEGSNGVQDYGIRNSIGHRFNSFTTNLNSSFSFLGTGSKIMCRDNDTDVRCINNATEGARTQTSSSSAYSAELILFRRATIYSENGICVFCAGASLTYAETQNFRTAYNQYLNKIGLTQFA